MKTEAARVSGAEPALPGGRGRGAEVLQNGLSQRKPVTPVLGQQIGPLSVTLSP